MHYTNALTEIFKQREVTVPITIEQAADMMKNKKIVLYGAGNFGAENCELLRKYGVQSVAFLDRSAGPGDIKMGLPVYHPDDPSLSPVFRNECTVLICITIPKKIMTGIKNDLAGWGYKDCKGIQDFNARYILYDDTGLENPSADYFSARRKKIERTLELMCDDESKQTYISCVRAHLLRDYSGAYETDFPEQYFDAGVPLEKGLSVFADCGAFNGDSLKAALKYTDKIDTYIAFEPVTSNFEVLSATVDENKEKICNAFLYPCAVADITGSARFYAAASSSYITNSSEGEILPLIKIDDALKDIPVTLLKMDIERMEIRALRGAENLIRSQKPDLAISAYHCVNHFWDIPCLLDDWGVGYKFYIRSHSAAALESILYCTV